MKRLLIAILLALPLLAAPAQAQTTEEQHLEFMGIPIDGTLNAFAQKLQAKGMEITVRVNGAILFYPETLQATMTAQYVLTGHQKMKFGELVLCPHHIIHGVH